jgi:predicted dithiol-disulfide oxidoreductase (DUF899 family)
MVAQTNLTNESAEYLAKREELRLAELELMRQREKVAALRRELPQGAVLQDYIFEDATEEPGRAVRLSGLFTAPGRALVVYHLMFGKKNQKPCPMCTMWIDGFNGVAHHLARNVDFVVVAAADPEALRAYAKTRGWDSLRLLSCGDNTFKRDLKSEHEDGGQDSTVSVLTKDADGTMRHFYTAHPWMSEEVRERGLDLLTPVYNVLDLTPQGRGQWYASLGYGAGKS